MLKKALPMAAVLMALSGCVNVHGPVNATSLATGPKNGTACSKSILFVYADGDASISAAKRNGGLTTVSSVDTHRKGLFPFYETSCTHVNGR
ncbi:TRL-like family protein [Saccharibacter sp. 17.LH.SD]|uniref:TRL-like family protein n=1 Tax=Saccharibacter sp. 17.LH.SD TaxID=2689393 RepID=UPI001926F21C|nr:TRL-like family protein [Saccharibacter sp. 17.LH.SD]